MRYNNRRSSVTVAVLRPFCRCSHINYVLNSRAGHIFANCSGVNSMMNSRAVLFIVRSLGC